MNTILFAFWVAQAAIFFATPILIKRYLTNWFNTFMETETNRSMARGFSIFGAVVMFISLCKSYSSVDAIGGYALFGMVASMAYLSFYITLSLSDDFSIDGNMSPKNLMKALPSKRASNA